MHNEKAIALTLESNKLLIDAASHNQQIILSLLGHWPSLRGPLSSQGAAWPSAVPYMSHVFERMLLGHSVFRVP